MEILSGYEPKAPLRFFEELCAIPHGSKNTKAISEYCVQFAKKRGLDVIQDDMNNVIITKKATPGYENEVGIIIQGHLDMVCVKTVDSNIDFMQDGLVLETDGSILWAKDTSLGGDDGIAIAMALAVLDADDIKHPQIEAIFTVDEEIGLLGAQYIDLSSITGKRLINIDSEDDSQILTSCAGGTFIEGVIPVKRVAYTGVEAILELKGLQGGHSGAEIHKERGNSNALMGRVLYHLKDLIEICEVNGGTATNVIPSRTVSTILFHKSNAEVVQQNLQDIVEVLKKEYIIAEPNISLTLTINSENTRAVIDEESKRFLLNALMNLPNGVQARSLAIADLVETSLNLGIFNTMEDRMVLNYSIRSSVESAKEYLVERISVMVELMSGSTEVKGDYPGWEYRLDSPLRDSMIKVYTDLFGKEPIIAAIHAGLECGLFSAKIEDLDCVSIGPNLHDIHSVNERMELASVSRIWDLLLGVLKMKI